MFDVTNCGDFPHEAKLYFEKCAELNTLRFMYESLNRGFRNIEKRLADLMEENQQLKIKLGEHKTNCQVLKEDYESGC